MRKSIFVILVILSACNSLKKVDKTSIKPAEAKIIPLKQFNGDTVQYVKTNFIKNKEKYIHKELNVLLNDLELPIKDFAISFDHDKKTTPYLFLSFDDGRTTTTRLASPNPPILLHVVWETPIPDSMQYILLRKYKGWTPEMRKFYSNHIVKDLFLNDHYK